MQLIKPKVHLSRVVRSGRKYTVQPRCGAAGELALTPYAKEVTCKRCKDMLERDMPTLQARFKTLKKLMLAQTKMRGAA